MKKSKFTQYFQNSEIGKCSLFETFFIFARKCFDR